jgi:fatty aldehyde-generating acyl-ACP reductase
MPSVAFIGHLTSVERYQELIVAARGEDLPLPPLAEVDRLVRRLSPMPVSDWWLRSPTGIEIHGRYIDMYYVVELPLPVKSGLARVRAACDEARKCGAKIAALGGFASILGEMSGVDLSAEFQLAFTTGNTLTAAAIAQQCLDATSSRTAITVVGAAGDVGSGVCRILAAAGRRVVLVGRNPRPLETLHAELPDSTVLDWDAAAPRVEAAILVASTDQGGISMAEVPHGALVLDAGHPTNAHAAAHLRYACAGRVLHAFAPPRTDLPAVVSDCAPGETHACLAEAVVLDFERRWEPFSTGRGNIHPPRAEEMLRMAERHGIVPASLHLNV